MKVDYQRAHFLAPTGLKVNGFRRAGFPSRSFADYNITVFIVGSMHNAKEQQAAWVRRSALHGVSLQTICDIQIYTSGVFR